jgi:hypothetical protein
VEGVGKIGECFCPRARRVSPRAGTVRYEARAGGVIARTLEMPGLESQHSIRGTFYKRTFPDSSKISKP